MSKNNSTGHHLYTSMREREREGGGGEEEEETNRQTDSDTDREEEEEGTGTISSTSTVCSTGLTPSRLQKDTDGNRYPRRWMGGGGGGGLLGRGRGVGTYATLSPSESFCITKGSDDSHSNVSFTVRHTVTTRCP